ncbi:putative RNA methyltransferase [Smittium culicis]|uniref:RNA methyltransferase n=1 Tax=Smittium culicis TaxID=133412 RepID=A0A1R1X7D7_9FUNG|nr:putative RNA methyltransferase [Smittium culicis]
MNTEKKRLRHGNYPNYYGYRNPGDWRNDPRLSAIPKEIFDNSMCIDIGCNTGILTIELTKKFSISEIVGVDIDQNLIKTARNNLYFANSLQNHIKKNESIELIESQRNSNCCDKRIDYNYFPISMPILFGTLPCRPSRLRKMDDFSNSKDLKNDKKETFTILNKNLNNKKITTRQSLSEKIKFYYLDYLNDETNWIFTEKADVIFALSITKWIHLNNGDEGIQRFFRKIFSSLKKGGYFILEPQPWDGYRKRSKITEVIINYYHFLGNA